jgi:hypothetical protein
MDGAELRTRIEADESASLTRLGSTAFLRAIAGGEPTASALVDAAAESEHAAHETFSAWAADEDDPEARAAFAADAGQGADHRGRVAAELDGWTPTPDAPGPMHAYLRGRETTIERIAGGMVGRPLVTLRTHERLVSFFERENESDCARGGGGDNRASRRAALFSDLRAETAAVLDDGLDLLEERCATGDEWETARLVAAYAIRLAADDAADALRALGDDVGDGG